MFYDKFLSLCTERGVSKQKACSEAGLSTSAWIRWSYGSKPSAISLHKICEYFGVTAESMIDDEREIVPAPDDEQSARQELLERTEMKVLFDAAKGVPAYKLFEVASQLMKWKEENT